MSLLSSLSLSDTHRAMKKSCGVLVSWLFVMLILCHVSARLLPAHQGDHPNSRANGIVQEDDTIASLMGLEGCDEKDVACQNRRMIAEAHLDYIYTQHQKP